MVNALRGFVETCNKYGQDQPEFVFTDKPKDNFKFFIQEIPSLALKQQQLDRKIGPPIVSAPIKECVIESEDDYLYLSTSREIDDKLLALLAYLQKQSADKQVVSFDTEWVYGSKEQYPPHGRNKIGVGRIGFVADKESKKVRAFVLHLRSLPRLPHGLQALLEDPTIVYVGKGVTGDLEKLGDDFECANLTQKIIRSSRYVDLAQLAVTQGVVDKASVGLQQLVLETLHQDLKKDDSVQSSDWNKKALTIQQKTYAALDALKSLQVYLHLMQLADLTACITTREAQENVLVQIVPKHGKVAPGTLSTIAGEGVIQIGNAWEPPVAFGLKRKSTRSKKLPTTQVVQVHRVLAPNLVIPSFIYQPTESSKPRTATLGDFAISMPFRIELPLTMLMKNSETATPSPPVNPGPPAQQENTTDKSVRWEAPSEQHEVINVDDTDHDSLRCELSADNIAIMNDVLAIAKAQELVPESPDVKLPKPPDRIVDQFKSVLGDNFHYQHRIVVPMKHKMKKAFYVAQMEAFFAWDPVLLENTKTALQNKAKMSKEEITTMMYYNPSYFKKTVPRRVLPPSMLYWRVCAVYATYGPLKDATTAKPLFNDVAWNKAQNVLEEILAGHVSDPPGKSFYTQKLDCYGEPVTNKHGLPMYSCKRGTNGTKNYHKQLLTLIGTWAAGTKLADPLRDEHRHCYNQSVLEQKRFGYPRVGHADTWLIDLAQILVEENHNVLLYPFWSNSCNFLDTNKTFGTIPLQSAKLTAAVNELQLDTARLTSKQSNGCCMGQRSEWQVSVSKTAVYLQNYYDKWRQNQHVKEAVKQAATKKDALRKLNQQLVPFTRAQHKHQPIPNSNVTVALHLQHQADLPLGETTVQLEATNDDTTSIVQDSVDNILNCNEWPQPLPLSTLPQACLDLIAP